MDIVFADVVIIYLWDLGIIKNELMSHPVAVKVVA